MHAMRLQKIQILCAPQVGVYVESHRTISGVRGDAAGSGEYRRAALRPLEGEHFFYRRVRVRARIDPGTARERAFPVLGGLEIRTPV
ncbi:hypothetical protein TUM17560_02990 [Serratia marcescens]|nr:hypothetical protein TUM17560_02990 [Serratia marcescens]